MDEHAKEGAPTKYDPSRNEEVTNYCLLGATDEKLADFLSVCVATIQNWKNEHQEFLDAIKKGKEIADSEIASSLYQRAKGYSHQEDVIFNDKGTPLIVPTVKHYAPDTMAAMYWLNNRQRENWKNRHAVDLGGQKDNPLACQPIFNCSPDGAMAVQNLLAGKKPDVAEIKQPDASV